VEVEVISHILVPLDGSALAECVLPHVSAIAVPEKARVTLLHVLEPPSAKAGLHAIDTIDWHLQKREAELYLETVASRLEKEGLETARIIQEGPAAECIVNSSHQGDVDLVAMSSHGRSGLSKWAVSSVVQKVILLSYKSILLVPAYRVRVGGEDPFHYQRLFVGLDASARAEYVLPLAIGLAGFHHSRLSLGMIIRKPEMIQRLPLSDEDEVLMNRITERNYRIAQHYLEQLRSEHSAAGVELEARIVIDESVISGLHQMVEEEDPDLVLLVAHAYSGEDRWPHGSTAASFITQGNRTLLVLQDLSEESIRHSLAESAARETKGH
jgi:nucleotide-binding universal stress UspA family protein